MRIEIDRVFKSWRPAILASLGPEKTSAVLEAMTRVILRARKAEAEGRISDMIPLMATCNTNDTIAAGYFWLEIMYRPVTDGAKGDPTTYRVAVLKPENAHDEADRASTREAA